MGLVSCAVTAVPVLRIYVSLVRKTSEYLHSLREGNKSVQTIKSFFRVYILRPGVNNLGMNLDYFSHTLYSIVIPTWVIPVQHIKDLSWSAWQCAMTVRLWRQVRWDVTLTSQYGTPVPVTPSACLGMDTTTRCPHLPLLPTPRWAHLEVLKYCTILYIGQRKFWNNPHERSSAPSPNINFLSIQ